MGVSYSVPDALPYVCAVYACACGRSAERHGRGVAEPPPGWVAIVRREETEHLCPECARSRRGP